MSRCLQLFLLHSLCAWLLLAVGEVRSLAVNLQAAESSTPQTTPALDQLQTTAEAAPISTPLPANGSVNNDSRSPDSDEQQKQAMMDSIRQHMLAKLNMEEPPQGAPPADTAIPAALLANYYAQLQAQQQTGDDPQKCREEQERITHFSRHPRLYYPDHFVSTVPAPGSFQMDSGDDGKGEEVKDQDKDKKGEDDSPSKEDVLVKSSASPMLYSLRFNELDFTDSDRLWSVKLQLYKTKAPMETKRGRNPLETVKVFRVVRMYAYGRTVKRHILLATKNIPSEDDGYVSFNITSGVKSWLESSPQESLELAIKIVTPQRVDTGLFFPPAIIFNVPSYATDEHNARLLVERLNEMETLDSNRVQDNLFRRRKRQTVQGVNSEYCYNNPNETNCCIKELTVDFHKDLGFDWIIYPTTFQPNYCKGQCSNPRWPSATASTAFLMKLRSSNPTAAAEPCCVAHETRSLTVFMRLGDDVVLNEIPDMIVDSCICR